MWFDFYKFHINLFCPEQMKCMRRISTHPIMPFKVCVLEKLSTHIGSAVPRMQQCWSGSLNWRSNADSISLRKFITSLYWHQFGRERFLTMHWLSFTHTGTAVNNDSVWLKHTEDLLKSFGNRPGSHQSSRETWSKDSVNHIRRVRQVQL